MESLERCERYYGLVQKWENDPKRPERIKTFCVIVMSGSEGVKIANYLRRKGYTVKLEPFGYSFDLMEIKL